METLPEPAEYRATVNGMVTRGGKGVAESHRFDTIQDAMRKARERLHDEEDNFIDPDPDPYGFATELENEYGINLLEPKWRSRPHDPLWMRRTTARARKAAVARLYLFGHKTREIAEQLSISEMTVLRDISSIQNEWRKSYIEDIEVLAARDLARLDEMFVQLAPAIERGEAKAVLAGVKIIEERSNILGYKHGVQVDIEQHIREIAEARGFDPDQAVSLAQRISIRYK